MCTRAHAPDPWKYSSQDSVHERNRTKLNFDKKKKEREREREREGKKIWIPVTERSPQISPLKALNFSEERARL